MCSVDRLRDDPPAHAAAFAAAHANDMTRYEVAVQQLLDRLVVWHKDIVNMIAGATVAAWNVHPRGWSKSPLNEKVPRPLEAVWEALALPKLPVLGDMPGWSKRAPSAWMAAAASGTTVPEGYRVPQALVGRAFSAVPYPFLPAPVLAALPFHLFGVKDGGATIDAMLD